jgi:hypothetical protein
VTVVGESFIDLPGDRGARLLQVVRERTYRRLPKPPYDALL